MRQIKKIIYFQLSQKILLLIKKNIPENHKIINKKCCNESCITNKNIYKSSKIAIIEK